MGIEEIQEEKSLMDDVLKESKEEVQEPSPKNSSEIQNVIGNYKRKYSFERVIESLDKKNRIEVSKLISDNEREKFLAIIYKIKTQLEYYQLFDKEYDILLKKKNNQEEEINKILKDLEFELKQFDSIIKFIMISLNDWLNLKGYLTKELTVEDWSTYMKKAYELYQKEAEDNTIQKIQEYRKDIDERIIKTNYLFYEYYDTFIKDKPIS